MELPCLVSVRCESIPSGLVSDLSAASLCLWAWLAINNPASLGNSIVNGTSFPVLFEFSCLSFIFANALNSSCQVSSPSDEFSRMRLSRQSCENAVLKEDALIPSAPKTLQISCRVHLVVSVQCLDTTKGDIPDTMLVTFNSACVSPVEKGHAVLYVLISNSWLCVMAELNMVIYTFVFAGVKRNI